MSASLTPLPISGNRPLSIDDRTLLRTLSTEASYIWTRELAPIEPPDAPNGEQRAFRKTFTYPTGKGRPKNVVIVMGADDYFAMYVDGALAHPANVRHEWSEILAFDIPLPPTIPTSASNSSNSELVLAFRVVNEDGAAGLTVAARVYYEDPSQPPDTFFTGLDQGWLGEKLFLERWEQPTLEMDLQTMGGASWAPAEIYPRSLRAPTELTMSLEQVTTFDRLSSGVTTIPGDSCDNQKGGSISGVEKNLVGLSVPEFAGVLVGSIALAFLVAGIASWYFTSRRYLTREERWTDIKGGVVYPEYDISPGNPTTQAGRSVAGLSPNRRTVQ